MQSFRISDALRCTLLPPPRGPNLACPRESLAGVFPGRQNALLWKNAVLQPADRVALAQWEGGRLRGLVSARIRCGRRAWEIDGLYFPGRMAAAAADRDGAANRNGAGATAAVHPPVSESDTAALELLEQLIAAIGWRSGERIFLRLAAHCPALPLARRSGFYPCFNETLLAGYGGIVANSSAGKGNSAAAAVNGHPAGNNVAPGGGDLRPRRPADDYALFQLFCASTPVAVRDALGLTFDQWQDAREPLFRPGRGGRAQEWVSEQQGRIIGWLGLASRRRAAEAMAMANPDYPERLAGLLAAALSRPGGQRWLVPEYRAAIADRLIGQGFREQAQYTMLVKLAAAPARSYGMAAVEA